jgi:hypothetical protein
MAACVAATLAGCANFDQLSQGWSLITGASPVQVTAKQAYLARDAFVVVQKSATVYLTKCHTDPGNIICTNKAKVEAVLVPAVRAGRSARDDLKKYMAAHPNGDVPQTLYDQITGATSAIKNVFIAYNVQVGG